MRFKKTVSDSLFGSYVIMFVGCISEAEQALDSSPPIPKSHYTGFTTDMPNLKYHMPLTASLETILCVNTGRHILIGIHCIYVYFI